MGTLKQSAKAALAACLSLAALAGAAKAANEITVLRSTAPGFSTGDMLTEGQNISVPADKVLDVISITGIQARITGYSGPLQVLGREVDTSRLAAVTTAVLGRDQGTTAIGGTRNLGSHVAVDLSQGGNWCMVNGVKLVVTRGGSMASESMVMKSLATGQTEELTWRRYAKSQDWPKTLPVTNGGRYAVGQQGVGTKTMTLHVLPDGLAPSRQIFALAEKKCTSQLQEMAAELDRKRWGE